MRKPKQEPICWDRSARPRGNRYPSGVACRSSGPQGLAGHHSDPAGDSQRSTSDRGESCDQTWVIVLAAGEGKRLRGWQGAGAEAQTPKQFWSPDCKKSMLRWAIERAACLVPRERIVCVVAEQHRQWWEPELRDLERCNVVVQPENRGTAAGILLPLLRVGADHPDANVVILPSDHFVAREATLLASLERGLSSLYDLDTRVMLLGMTADDVDSGYGWILPAGPSSSDLRMVLAFVEKPDLKEASSLLRQGALINSFMVLGHLRSLLLLYQRRLPELLEALDRTVRSDGQTGAELRTLYQMLPSADFSRDVLQAMPERLALLSVPRCGWTDLGTPPRLQRFLHEIGGDRDS